MKPNLPFSSRSTATSAGAPTERCPNSSCWISLAGFQVDRRITSSRDIPIARNESRLHQRNRASPAETRSSVANVENDAAFAALDHCGAGAFGVGVLLAANPSIHVGVDVTGTEIFREQLHESAVGAHITAEIDHYRDTGDLSDLLRIDVGFPL